MVCIFCLQYILNPNLKFEFCPPKYFPILSCWQFIKFVHVLGAETYPNVALPWVHIKDVAEAHIRAFEIPSAHGRCCLVESVVHHSEIVKLLHKHYPTLQLPNKWVLQPFKSKYVSCLITGKIAFSFSELLAKTSRCWAWRLKPWHPSLTK